MPHLCYRNENGHTCIDPIVDPRNTCKNGWFQSPDILQNKFYILEKMKNKYFINKTLETGYSKDMHSKCQEECIFTEILTPCQNPIEAPL